MMSPYCTTRRPRCLGAAPSEPAGVAMMGFFTCCTDLRVRIARLDREVHRKAARSRGFLVPEWIRKYKHNDASSAAGGTRAHDVRRGSGGGGRARAGRRAAGGVRERAAGDD